MLLVDDNFVVAVWLVVVIADVFIVADLLDALLVDVSDMLMIDSLIATLLAAGLVRVSELIDVEISEDFSFDLIFWLEVLVESPLDKSLVLF